MNQTMKHALHVIGLALGVSLLMGLWDIVSAIANIAIPVLKAGGFPHLNEIGSVMVPACAKALGGFFESFMTVAALYAAKIKFLGSSQKADK